MIARSGVNGEWRAPNRLSPVLSVAGPMLHQPRLVAGVAVVPVADLAGFLPDPGPVLDPEVIIALADQARRRTPW